MLTLTEFTAVLTSGFLAGALLTEACVLVPYWRRMVPSEFLRLHPTLAPTLFRFFAPLTILGTSLPLGAWVLSVYMNRDVMTWAVPALSAVGILAFYFLFFRRANISFAETSNTDEASVTLNHWAKLHNLRTGVAMIGFAASVMAYAS